MRLLAWKILVCETMLAWQRLRALWREQLLVLMPPLLRQARCARRMECLAVRLALMRRKIAAFEASLLDGSFREPVDADFAIRVMLKGLKENIRHIRCEIAAVPQPVARGYGGVKLRAAMERLHVVAEETYLAADRLLWEIGEHDLRCIA